MMDTSYYLEMPCDDVISNEMKVHYFIHRREKLLVVILILYCNIPDIVSNNTNPKDNEERSVKLKYENNLNSGIQ